MKKTANIIIYTLLISCLLWLISVYPKLPQTIPTHWGLNGQPDGYSNKQFVFFIYGITVLSTFIFDIAKKVDPKSDNYNRFETPFYIFKIVFTVFMIALLIVTTSVNFNSSIAVDTFIVIGLGLLYAIIGNYMPKFKHNYTMGIKTPWTLENETVWNKTHRMAGPMWLVGGLLIIVLAIFTRGTITFTGILLITIVISIVPVVYSYIEYKKQKDSDK